MIIINHIICFVHLLLFPQGKEDGLDLNLETKTVSESLSHVVRNARYAYIVIAYATKFELQFFLFVKFIKGRFKIENRLIFSFSSIFSSSLEFHYIKFI